MNEELERLLLLHLVINDFVLEPPQEKDEKQFEKLKSVISYKLDNINKLQKDNDQLKDSIDNYQRVLFKERHRVTHLKQKFEKIKEYSKKHQELKLLKQILKEES